MPHQTVAADIMVSLILRHFSSKYFIPMSLLGMRDETHLCVDWQERKEKRTEMCKKYLRLKSEMDLILWFSVLKIINNSCCPA